MLAGRKLLLADDSATIQKVIDLTFADEGVQVVSVSNGREAIDRLLEIRPDVVLADVFMPPPNGYEVCEYVKTNEQLKHIPVMLLVGSFEPFDEAEARRVGADDILTKPFQSIRRLIDRVGALVSSPPVEKESPTRELPHVDAAEEEHMDTHELEISTADTQRLDEDQLNELQAKAVGAKESISREENMETGVADLRHDSQADQADTLLDLGDIEPVRADADEFVLELDDEVSEPVGTSSYQRADEPQRAHDHAPAYQAAPAYEPAPSYDSAPSYEARAFVEPQVTEATPRESEIHDAFADTQDVSYAIAEPEPEAKFVTSSLSSAAQSVSSAAESASSAARAAGVGELSPEMIDAIARRAVELMSDKVIREIAWEVIPDLAELLIKKQLEETK